MTSSQIPTMVENVGRFATRLKHSVIALIFLGVCPSGALAQGGHSHTMTTQQTAGQDSQAAALIQSVRQATERFKDVTVAEKEGYALGFGCVSGDDYGAMGLHYINGDILNGGEVDVNRPQIVIYEPQATGQPRLIGADYLVFAKEWDKKKVGPPQLMGQLFHYFESPNRFGLPAFYTLHVWAWKDNPNGAFVNWHPNVSCKSFAPQNP
jgi:hypothetical protein